MIWLLTPGDEVSETGSTVAMLHKMADEPYPNPLTQRRADQDCL